MKKILFTLVAAAAALTFTNCQKEETVAPESVGQPFEIVASPETRTVNDGMSTKWADGDAVNVFHAVEGSTNNYINDGEFTLADVTTGTFTGTLTGDALTENSNYDWYMFYPYSYFVKTPANTSSGYMPVGCNSNATQAQTGIDNMSHIAGPNYPMAGKVEGVMGGEKPHITMTHLTALVRVNVTNNNAEDLTVTSIKLTAAEDIVGTYYIDFSGDTPSFIGSGDSYVSATATLDVTEGVVAAGKTAAFYLAIKPYVLENEDLTVTIAANGYESFEKTFTGLSTSFTAGKIKTINVAYETEAAEALNWPLITDAAMLTNGAQVAIAASAYDFACGDQNTYYRNNVDITKGDNVLTYGDAENLIEVFNVVSIADADNTYYALQSTKSSAGKFLYAPTGSNNNLTSNVCNSQNTLWTIAVTEAGVATITNVANSRVIQYNVSNPRFATYTSASQAAVAFYLVKEGNGVKTPVFTAAAETTALTCDATEASFNVKSNVAWTAEITSANAWFDSANTTTTISGEGCADVNLYFTGNTDTTNPKEITVKITTTEEADTNEYTLTYSLEAYAAAKYYTKVTANQDDWTGSYLLVEEYTTPAKALSAISTTKTKYGIGTEVDVVDSQIRYTEAVAAYEVTIAKTADGYYSMTLNGSLLTWISGNSLNVTTTASTNAEWSIAWDDENKHIAITNVATPERQIWWNVSSPRFACYTDKSNGSSYAAPQLYKLSE